MFTYPKKSALGVNTVKTSDTLGPAARRHPDVRRKRVNIVDCQLIGDAKGNVTMRIGDAIASLPSGAPSGRK
jgi:hypothetical protein